MKVYVTVFTANDGMEEPIAFIGVSKEEIVNQIKSQLLYNDDFWFNEAKEEIENDVTNGSTYTNYTEFPYSVHNYEKEIDV